jgi:hypothetical protein
MTLSPPIRKLALAVHLSCSVGWLGAVVAYLALDLTVTTSRDPQLVRAAWIGMGMVVSSVIVPLAVASLITGLLMALGTKWGLFRHWWVLISFVLTILATLVLLSETRLISSIAKRAADPGTIGEELLSYPPTLPHSVGGLLVLLTVQFLNVYKPRGLTPYGWRKQEEQRRTVGRSAAGRRLSVGAKLNREEDL